MANDDRDTAEILESYEKQFANTAGAEKIVAAQGLMTNKLHAVTQELVNLALHGEKEEVRLRACVALQLRVMGSPDSSTVNDPADQMFRMLEAKSRQRNKD